MQLFSIPFGLQMNQDIFQFKIDKKYHDCKGATGIADDVTVYGQNDKEHDLHQLENMECTNDKKCMVKTKECNFFQAQIKSEPQNIYNHPKTKMSFTPFWGWQSTLSHSVLIQLTMLTSYEMS